MKNKPTNYVLFIGIGLLAIILLWPNLFMTLLSAISMIVGIIFTVVLIAFVAKRI